MYENNKSILTSAVVLLVLIVVGGIFVIGYQQGQKKVSEQASLSSKIPPPPTHSTSTKQLVAEGVPHYMGSLGPVGGKVTAVNGNSLVLDGRNKIIVNSSTEVYRPGKEKSEVEYQKELDAFFKEIGDNNKNPNVTYVAPDRFTHESVAFSTISIGDDVLVTPSRIEGDAIVALSVALMSKPATQ